MEMQHVILLLGGIVGLSVILPLVLGTMVP